MNERTKKTFKRGLQILFAGYTAVWATGNSPIVWANPTTSSAIQKVRSVKTHLLFGEEFYRAGKPDLSGVAFPPGAHTLLIFNKPAEASVVLVTPPKNEKDKALRTAIEISDSINIAFDTVSQGAKGFGLYRLFLLDAKLGKLIAIKANAQDVMQPAMIEHFDAKGFGVINPQGMTIDPRNNRLYILDASKPRLVALDPQFGRDFSRAKHTEITLPDGLGPLRGIAFNISDRHLYVANPQQQKLFKLTLDGKYVASFDFAEQQGALLQGMIFAPSLDSTDSPSVFHLYMAINQRMSGENIEWALPSS